MNTEIKNDLPTKEDNVKNLYSQVTNKTEAIKAVADACSRRPNTVKTHWLTEAGLWSYPIEFEDTIISVLQNIIKNQNSTRTT